MTELRSLLVFLGDPRIAPHATSPCPVWLWSADATRILWANPAGAAVFNAPSPAALAGHTIDPKGTAALQIARLAGTLPHGAAPRLERLRGLGGRMGGPLLCGCSRVILADRTPAILIVSTEPAGPRLPLAERALRLLAGCDEPIALFSPDGGLLHATPAGFAQLGRAITLAALGVAPLGGEALTAGRAAGSSIAGAIAIDRIGADGSTVLLATFAPHSSDTVEPEALPPVEASTPIEAQPAPPIEASVPAEAAATEHTAAPSTPAPPIEDSRPAEEPAAAAPEEQPAPPSSAPATTPRSAAGERRLPLRFVWQMDFDGRFTIDSPDFIALIGPEVAAVLGRPWSEIAASLRLDPDGQVARAFASHDTWSGITASFPVGGSDQRLAVELSGLPVFDRDRNFRGYRGFGVCRDIGRIAGLARAQAVPAPETPSAPRVEPPVLREERPTLTVVPPSVNVVPFRSSAPPDKSPSLTPVERKAFNELADRLTARLRSAEDPEPPAAPASGEPSPSLVPPPPSARISDPAAEPKQPPAARSPASDQRPILDRLPVGVLVYRLDKLIYANRAFLDWTGYQQLHELAEAGGLDALFVEPSGNALGETNGAKSLTIATNRGDQLPVEARLFTSPWEGESALVLMLASVGGDSRHKTLEAALRSAQNNAAELRSMLDTATDGVVLFGRDGHLISANRSAEALFGYESRELAGLPFESLFAPESQRAALEYVNRLHQGGVAGTAGDGCEVLGRPRSGASISLFMTIGTIADGADRLCAVFRDLTAWKTAERELTGAKRKAETASAAKSDFLAKVSHEIRTPLNAIIGFSEVMMQERFGPIGNDRYKQYLQDIHASGGHLVALLNDLLDLSKIEAGRLQLEFAEVDLNAVTQQCVALMQPQAARERVIIRSSLAPALAPVVADARSVRQIVLNLLSNSIKFTGAGGQVIVSTAANDQGEVVLRVRDTGVGMSEQEIAIALEPFRQLATSARVNTAGSGLGLPLTKALTEANRASFSIKSAVNAGTLVEIAFSGVQIAAE